MAVDLCGMVSTNCFAIHFTSSVGSWSDALNWPSPCPFWDPKQSRGWKSVGRKYERRVRCRSGPEMIETLSDGKTLGRVDNEHVADEVAGLERDPGGAGKVELAGRDLAVIGGAK